MNLIKSRSVLLKMRNTQFFLSKNRVVYEVMRKNFVQPSKPQMTTGRLRVADTQATNTLSEYVILIAFPLQQMVERTRLNITF